MKVCPRCSSSVDSKFCPECGYDLSAVVAECNEVDETIAGVNTNVLTEEAEKIKAVECDKEFNKISSENVLSEKVENVDRKIPSENDKTCEQSDFTTGKEQNKEEPEKSEDTIFDIIKRSPAAIFVCAVVALLALMLLLRCNHEWQPATCTEPATCSKCEKTEGEALGHNEGDWEPEGVDGVKATISYSKKCTICDETIDNKTEKLDSLISGDTLYMTPTEFVKRLGNKLDGMGGNKLTTSDGESEGKFACGILEDGDKVGAILFTDGDYAISYSERNDEAKIQSMLGTVNNDDNTARVLVALIETCDPSISFDEAKNLAKEVAESGDKTKNGITYLYLPADGGTVLGVAVEE